MKDYFAFMAWALGITLVCLMVSAVLTGGRMFLAPANTAIDNAVFQQSQQYNDGMVRDLDNIRREYLADTTSAEAKAALRATIMHRFAVYPTERLPGDLRLFLNQVRGY